MQQGSEEWKAARLGKVTASRVADVMATIKSGYAASRQNYLVELLCQRLTNAVEEGYTNAAMQRGVELEPVARSWYEVETGVMVEECGFIQHPKIPNFGASPDGLVGSDGLLEIKAPNTATHIATIQRGAFDPKYRLQMMAQLACTGRKWCDFVSYDDRLPEKLKGAVFRFTPDAGQVEEMEGEVVKFLTELNELETEMREKMK